MTEPTQPPRIRISHDDLASPQVDAQLEAMEEARKVALVRDVGTPQSTSSGALRAILTLVAGGAVGGIVAFLLNRVLLNGLGLFDDNSFLNNVTFTFILAFCIGLAVALASVITEKSLPRLGMAAAIAVPTAIGAALVMGVIAHIVYSAGLDWIFNSAFEQIMSGDLSESDAESFVQLRMHPLRGIAWALVGVGAGVAAGASSRSWKRLGLAAAGGAIGGFLGGFLFDFIPSGDSESSLQTAEMIAQFIGITLLGVLIGLAMGLLEQAGKSRWIEIVAGGLAGKQFILYKNDIVLGSSPRADITLIKDPAIGEFGAQLTMRGSRATISVLDTTTPVLVNGAAVATADIRDSDIISVGNTQLRFREKSSSQKVPGALT